MRWVEVLRRWWHRNIAATSEESRRQGWDEEEVAWKIRNGRVP